MNSRGVWKPLSLCLALLFSLGHSSWAGPLQNGDIVFCDASLDAIIVLHPATGQTNYLAAFRLANTAGGIALDRAGNIYALASPGGFDAAAQFSRLNWANSKLESVSTDRLITSANRMIVSGDGGSLLVAGSYQTTKNAIFQVDLATGKQRILTTNLTSTFMGVIPATERPWSLGLAADGRLFMGDNAYAHVVEFGSDGSNRRLVRELPFPFSLNDIAVDARGQIYVSGLNAKEKIFQVDPTTGEAAAIVTTGLIKYATGLTAAPDGSLLVCDAISDTIIRLDPVTGEQNILLAGIPAPRTPCVYVGIESPPPTLTIRRASESSVGMSWTDGTDEWRLQESVGLLPPTPWQSVMVTPSRNGETRSVELPADSGQKWFRLAQP